jgi:hypothetical protein
MTQPSTGTTWNAGGFNDISSNLTERGGLQAVLIRDYRGAETNISPFQDDLTTWNWSPFAVNGALRADLMIRRRVDGVHSYVEDANEGWFYIGAQTEDGGAERDPQMESDDFMVLQSTYPIDSEVTERGYTVKFTAVQTADPLLQFLEGDFALTDAGGSPLVPLPGAANHFTGGGRLDTAQSFRQIVLIFAKNAAGGKKVYRAEAYPLVKLDNQAAKRRGKTDPDTAELTFKVIPDPFFMIPDPDGAAALVPGPFGIWYSGDGWDAIGTPSVTEWLVDLGTQTSGTFTLTWRGNTTTAIAYNATNATVKTALVALDDGYTASDWTVTGSSGGPYTVTAPTAGTLTGSGASLEVPGDFEISAA